MNLHRILDPFNSQANLDTMTSLINVTDDSLFDSKAWWSQYRTFIAKSAGNGVISAVAGLAVVAGGGLLSVKIADALDRHKNSKN